MRRLQPWPSKYGYAPRKPHTHPDCDLKEDLVRPAGRRVPSLQLPLLAIQHSGAVPALHSSRPSRPSKHSRHTQGLAEGEEGVAARG
jgi:hypothetical protein